MPPVLILLLSLFVALIVLVPLIEKFGPRFSPEQLSRYQKFIWPLLMILLVTQLIYTLI
ncbi:hypothetical protein [Pseudoalteromonas denitrificans]|uniref:Uncharacterized protein n=1 Tax=Pseudoalteromonas denitrificans DSM 6059 TaxID=1123010 RepID=A0A1I1PMJ6_9GAMM|nr:hypothetical protein [Pseudoalteromonas denitrificans]SFD11031.1 hypothetical protein SAMN02745724_03513 [Pseudoalteromonas denitrificans DSM 6059]